METSTKVAVEFDREIKKKWASESEFGPVDVTKDMYPWDMNRIRLIQTRLDYNVAKNTNSEGKNGEGKKKNKNKAQNYEKGQKGGKQNKGKGKGKGEFGQPWLNPKYPAKKPFVKNTPSNSQSSK